MTIFLMILLLGSDTLDLDEIYVNKFAFATQNSDKVLFSGIKGFEIPLFIYDFQTNRVTAIDDGRIKSKMPYLVSDEKGFMLVNRVGGFMIETLDQQGAYRETKRYDHVLEPAEKIAQAQRWQDNILLTLHKDNRSRLVSFDPQSGQMTTLTSRNDSDGYRDFWFRFNQAWYRYTRETGQVLQLDAQFEKVAQVKQGIEPVERENQRRFKYRSVLNSPILHPQYINFSYTQVRDRFGEIQADAISNSWVMTKDTTDTYLDVCILGIYKDKMLIYHWEEGEFQLADLPKTLAVN